MDQFKQFKFKQSPASNPASNEEFHPQFESIQTKMRDTAHSHIKDDLISNQEFHLQSSIMNKEEFHHQSEPNLSDWWWDESTHSNYYANEDESTQSNTLDELVPNEESHFPSESTNNNLTNSETNPNPSIIGKFETDLEADPTSTLSKKLESESHTIDTESHSTESEYIHTYSQNLTLEWAINRIIQLESKQSRDDTSSQHHPRNGD